MSKFSVKKPLTVFVAVVAIIVLGVVAFMNMTPDLLPNIDLPYMVVVTTYPGASPERVETEVTKPLEQTMATLEGIDTVMSTSSENVSMIILSFATEANMDAVTVDILQKVEQIKGRWDDLVNTPYILKINPDMLPVTVGAIDIEGMETGELSAFVEGTLMNQLEGITGVASVSATGLIEEKLNVIISQEKIDEVNRTVRRAIDDQFAEAEGDLRELKDDLEGNLSDLEAGQSALDRAKQQLADTTSQAAGTINDQQRELAEGKVLIAQQIVEFSQQLEELQSTREQLAQLQSRVAQLEAAEAELNNTISLLEGIQANLGSLEAAESAFQQQIAAIEANIALTEEEKQAEIARITGSAEYIQTAGALAEIDAQLSARGLTRSDVPTALARAKVSLAEARTALAAVDVALSAMGLSRATLVSTLAELDSGIAQLTAGIQTLNDTLKQMEQGDVMLSDALVELDKQKTLGILTIGENTTQMILGGATLESALTQVEDGLEQIDDMRQQSYDKADLSDTITMSMVASVLYAQNFSMPAGYIEDDGVQYLVSVGDEFSAPTEIEDLLLFDLGMDGVDPIYLADVADIFWVDNLSDIYAKINGNNGVMLSFSKQSNYATAEVSDNIQKKFEQLADEHDGLSFTTLMDQGDYIHIVVDSIFENLISGAVLAIIVLFIFLRDIRPTIITLASIPISVVFAIVLMYFSGITLNMISLSGLAVSVGMLVDNSVVVIENIYRLRSKGATAAQAAVAGASQVGGAIIASTLTTVCVFLPIVFVEGITRQLFTDMALTMGYALMASLIVALTLVPAMSSGMLRTIKNPEQKWFERMMAGYEKMLNWTLNHKPLILGLAVVLLVASFVIALSRGYSFMPEMEMEQLSATLEMPEDSTFDEATAMADLISTRIQGVEGVDTVGAMISGSSILSFSSTGGSDSISVTMYILFDEDNRRSTGDIAAEIDRLVEDLDCEFTTSSSSGMDISALGGSGVTIRIYGDNLDDLQQTSREVGQILEGVEGLTNVSDGLEDNDLQISFIVDKDKAMKEGLTVAQIFSELAALLSTEASATTLSYDGYDYEVIVGSGKDELLTLDYLQNYPFTVTDMEGEEKEVLLKDIATMVEKEALSSISRVNNMRYTSVSAELEEGYNVTQVTQEAQRAMADYKMSDGSYYEFTGENETIMEAMVQLIQMLALGVLLVYLIMVAQFQSLKSPFIVMFTIPLAFTGGMLGLIFTGHDVSVISMIGFVMLTGIIVNNGIVLVDYINQLRAEGVQTRQAIIEAGVTRMRPILMTTITTVFGLVFMALGIGTGASIMQPIAIVCIGGLVYATLLTLFVVPAIYEMMNRKELHVITDADLDLVDVE